MGEGLVFLLWRQMAKPGPQAGTVGRHAQVQLQEELPNDLNYVAMDRAASLGLVFPITEVFQQKPEDHWKQCCLMVWASNGGRLSDL